MTEAEGAATTRDAFLGGRITLHQPRVGYRAGIDPVLLAAAVPAKPGQSVLDLGCGVGAALYCLGARTPGLELHGLEIQPDYAALARRNGAENDLPAEIHLGDVAAPPPGLKARRFDHVFANPPYFEQGAATPAEEPGRRAGRHEATALALWVTQAAKRCAPRGTVTLIFRADRLEVLLGAMASRIGSLRILPIAPRAGRDARLILVQGQTGGRAPTRLHAPLILHQGESHQRDGESYRPEVSALLRDCAALPWPR
ncbi:tRNA1(Val) (adenine(37)-N6)-methyltransferase [Poseidonocella sedimentorum]|uniref:tRNA1(Val) A37 N6-methylase TrmN6 n=1 Tax=Poseidonocella sedimentorum TaxID=871652 RepID=A0A1I6D9Q8_9RHOB|nr:methyltransferase [Poseidonocella sedimentorum]SFR02196.1 tRNA1(Val) A37 N6-methylase TrmN6 [Poseidonocella sedimentorum]